MTKNYVNIFPAIELLPKLPFISFFISFFKYFVFFSFRFFCLLVLIFIFYLHFFLLEESYKTKTLWMYICFYVGFLVWLVCCCFSKPETIHEAYFFEKGCGECLWLAISLGDFIFSCSYVPALVIFLTFS